MRKKAFLFLGATAIKLKLLASLPEAVELQSKESDRYKVGALGWVDVKFSKAQPLPLVIPGATGSAKATAYSHPNNSLHNCSKARRHERIQQSP